MSDRLRTSINWYYYYLAIKLCLVIFDSHVFLWSFKSPLNRLPWKTETNYSRTLWEQYAMWLDRGNYCTGERRNLCKYRKIKLFGKENMIYFISQMKLIIKWKHRGTVCFSTHVCFSSLCHRYGVLMDSIMLGVFK